MRESILQHSMIVLALSASTGLAVAQDQAAGVLVNGTLNVPGAAVDGEAVPAKFSARNDADDQRATADYTLGTLTPEQRLAIYHGVTGNESPEQKSAPQPSGLIARVGAELPPLLALQSLPGEVTAQFPQIGRYRYAMLGDKLVLVEPNTMYVIGVLVDEK